MHLHPPVHQIPCPSLKSLSNLEQTWLMSQPSCRTISMSFQDSNFYWSSSQPLKFSVADSLCVILKNMLGGFCCMRLGRYAMALVYWYEAFSAMQHIQKSWISRLQFFVCNKLTQTLIEMHVSVIHLNPLIMALYALADPILDYRSLQVTIQMLFANTGCFSLSKEWVAPLISNTTFFNNRYTLDQLFIYLQDCFYRAEMMVAVDTQRLLRYTHLREQLESSQHSFEINSLKSLLNCIYFVITQKLQPVFQRFYFNRYLSYKLETFKLRYEVLVQLLKQNHLDPNCTLISFHLTLSDIKKRICIILDDDDLVPEFDLLYLHLKTMFGVLDAKNHIDVLYNYFSMLRDQVVKPRVLFTFSVEEADLYFTFGMYFHLFLLSKKQQQYNIGSFYQQSLLHYQKTVNFVNPPNPFGRIEVCQLLQDVEQTSYTDMNTYIRLMQWKHDKPIYLTDPLCILYNNVKQVFQRSVPLLPAKRKHNYLSEENLKKRSFLAQFQFSSLRVIPAVVDAFHHMTHNDAI